MSAQYNRPGHRLAWLLGVCMTGLVIGFVFERAVPFASPAIACSRQD